MGYFLTYHNAISVAQDLKKQGKQVIFTHGAFDLFHAGHSLFLNYSKKEGDVLIVGLEPDCNVSKYKGNLRPIIKQDHRKELVVNHNSVDFSFFVEDLNDLHSNYYLELYKKINPDMVTLGKRSGAKANFMNEKYLNNASYKVKHLNTEVTSTTKIITSVLNAYNS